MPKSARTVSSAGVEAGTLAVTPEMWGSRVGPQLAKCGRTAWFAEAKFGLFIHWGLYSELAGSWKETPYHGIGEWIQYRARIPARQYAKTALRFNPSAFNAREWVRRAQDAGARYLVITAKHHDGFAMFKSAASPFNIVDATPFKRDPLAELAEACRDAALRLGFYYSQTQDWHEPDAVGNAWDKVAGERRFDRYLAAKALPQIEELLTNYGDVSILWFDTPGPIAQENSLQLLERIRRLQPNCLVNSRIGNGLGDYASLGDQEIPRQPRAGLWETIDTHNDTWGYVAHDRNWKSPAEIVRRLAQVAACGGNYVLNVGPDGRGRIPAVAGQILESVGAWTRTHGTALYGATPASLGPVPWGACTVRGKSLFLHVFDWPRDGRLIVPGTFAGEVAARIQLRRGGKNLRVEPVAGGLIVHTPSGPPDPLVSVITLELEAPARGGTAAQLLTGWPLRLDAQMAQTRNCRLRKRSWMEKFGDWKHAECLVQWEDSGAEAIWSFAAFEAGMFYVDVDYTSPAGATGSEWQLRMGKELVPFSLSGTGEAAAKPGDSAEARPLFRLYRVGLFELNAGGKQTLRLRLKDLAGSTVSIRSVTLVPSGRA